MVWADPRSLAATRGVSFDLLSSGYLDVSVPLLTLPTSRDDPALPGSVFSIRVSPAKLARQLTEAFRRLATPFIGPWSQGIHRKPLLT